MESEAKVAESVAEQLRQQGMRIFLGGGAGGGVVVEKDNSNDSPLSRSRVFLPLLSARSLNLLIPENSSSDSPILDDSALQEYETAVRLVNNNNNNKDRADRKKGRAKAAKSHIMKFIFPVGVAESVSVNNQTAFIPFSDFDFPLRCPPNTAATASSPSNPTTTVKNIMTKLFQHQVYSLMPDRQGIERLVKEIVRAVSGDHCRCCRCSLET